MTKKQILSLIPWPKEVIEGNNNYNLSPESVLFVSSDFSILISYLEHFLQEILGWKGVLQQSGPEQATIVFKQSAISESYPESYSIKIKDHRVWIEGLTNAGLFYGLQTLQQLLEVPDIKPEAVFAPEITIQDAPRFRWRGYMLDIGRHYHPPETIKRILDVMATLKMNRFHWHLTEDQGWRVEIKKYPKLTEIGSKRKDTKIGGHLSKKFRGIPHEGFYMQAQVKEIVQYAKERFIEVIPEIDIPGHSLAALAAYPNLSCTNGHFEVAISPGIFPDIYCAGKEETFEFLQNVFDEIIEMFPSPIIHIGGDEAPKKRWKACELCQKRMVEQEIKDEHELQVYFTNRIAAYLKQKGRRVMGWNEILGESLDPSAIAQWWVRNKQGVLSHLRNGREFVMSKVGFVYLDYNYILSPLKKCYHYEPIPKELEPQYHENVLGIEAPLWTEWVPNWDRLDWQTFPRLIAVAETGWTPKSRKDYDFFRERLPQILERLKKYGVKSTELEDVDPPFLKRIFKLHTILQWPEV